MKKIFIENYLVDVDRCLVHRENDTFSLEPKVVQVLTYLAQHQGEVVSYQTLLDEIWPNSIVDPSALQRCIGQLRKAFQDDAKQQRVIATYSKKGYSLIARVEWESPKKKNKRPKALLPAAGILFLIFVAMLVNHFFYPASAPSEGGPFSTIAPPQPEDISSDFYAAYSPNGRYVIYPRFTDGSLRHLWARDLSNDSEYQLTGKSGIYEGMAWSADSEHIVFIESNCLDEKCQNIQCSSLNLLSLPLKPRMSTQNLIPCQSSHLQYPQWLDANNIALIEKNSQHAQIIKYELSSADTQTLFQQADKIPHHLTFSTSSQKLAITTTLVENHSQQELLILSLITGKLTKVDTSSLPDSVRNEIWYPIWNHLADGLLIPGSSGLFNIDLEGNASEQKSPYLPQPN